MSLPSKDSLAAMAVTRFGLGARPGEIARVAADPKGWLKAQVRAEAAPVPLNPVGLPFPDSRARLADFANYRAAEKAAGTDPDRRRASGEMFRQGIAAEILGRISVATTTEAPFAERWVLFWSNHFTVSTRKSQELDALAASFEREAIRPHVFGRFETLLTASCRHPAMLLYLDQPGSLGPNSRAGLRRTAGLNENLAREILELHTLGVNAGYSQADVTEFARVLTGWSVGRKDQPAEVAGGFMYRPNLHEPGARTVFGHSYPAGEEDQALRVLADLAASGKTAVHLATKLATHFVADDPDPQLVRRLAEAYHDSRGDLAVVARTLIDAPEAWTDMAAKVKTPYELLVSAYRAIDQTPRDYGREVNRPLNLLGQRPLSAPQPNGWSDRAADWAAPDALVKRLQWAQGFAASYANQVDPVQLATDALGARLRPLTLATLQRAESRKEALAVLLMSPEFQRR
jgi:uncharacterized protein (DUF1800 family)